MIKLEKLTNYYNQNDLIDIVNNKEDINDFTKKVICTYIDAVSIQLIELGYQMNRQPMNLDIHKQYSDLNNIFAEVIFELLDTKIYSENDLDKILCKFTTNVDSFCNNINAYLPEYIAEHISSCNETIQSLTSKFSTENNGLLDKDLEISQVDTDFVINDNSNISDFLLNTSKNNNSQNVQNVTKQHKQPKQYRVLRHRKY